MSNNIIPIFYACDDGFIPFMVVSLKSMMENASKDFNYNIHILHTEISHEMKNVLYNMENENFKVYFNNVSEYLKVIKDSIPIRDYYTPTTYYRMFIAEMFPEYNKAIYIDSDTVVLGDISELYNKDLGSAYLGAANEQVMIQEDIYGTYVEKVLGINREDFFNAGVLLINCHMFRTDKVLEEFIKLTLKYNFVVTQDEDYLNVICRGNVLWIEQQWNTEIFGTIDYEESEFKIVHYVMTSKPWHYFPSRFGKFFWNYAKKTEVYQEIMKTLNDYTDEQRNNDEISCENLAKLAKKEIERKGTF